MKFNQKMKLSINILEKSAQFYLDNHSIKETCEFIFKNYGIMISNDGLRKRLIKIGIPKRDREEVAKIFLRKKLPKDEIKKIIEMYVKDLCSIRKISRDLKLKRRIIRRVLTESGIKRRDNYTSLKLTNQKHEKIPFDGDENEKAYLIGLVKGDLTPTKKSRYSLRLTVGSTHKNFIQFLKSIFSKYGPVYIYPAKDRSYYQWKICAELEMSSFKFLLEAKQEESILNLDADSFIYFLAGLIDTDGSIYIRKAGKYAQYMVRVFGQDVILLEKINNILHQLGFNSILYVSSRKGEVRNHNGWKIKYNKDYYILELSRKEEVFKLISSLPLMHPEKIARKKIMLDLIKRGIIYYKDTEKMLELRNKIKKEVIKDVKEAKVEYKKRK